MSKHVVTSQQLRNGAAALRQSYPSVRQYAQLMADAADRIEELERAALLVTFEDRATKGRKAR